MFRPPRKADPPARPPPPAVGGAPAQAPAVPAPGAPPAGTAPAAAPNPYAGNTFSFSIHIFFSSHDHCSRRPRPAAVPGAADDADAVRELHADAGRLQPVRRVPAARRRARPAPARLPPAVLPAAAAVRPRPRPGISATAGVSNIPLPLSLTYGIFNLTVLYHLSPGLPRGCARPGLPSPAAAWLPSCPRLPPAAAVEVNLASKSLMMQIMETEWCGVQYSVFIYNPALNLNSPFIPNEAKELYCIS